jgi:hypothetical protein
MSTSDTRSSTHYRCGVQLKSDTPREQARPSFSTAQFPLPGPGLAFDRHLIIYVRSYRSPKSRRFGWNMPKRKGRGGIAECRS